MKEILRKAKAIETHTNNKFGRRGSPQQSGGVFNEIDDSQLLTTEQAISGGLYDQIDNTSGGSPMSNKLDPSSPVYENSVKNSNLPDAVKNAMMSNPIPTPGLVDDFSPEMIQEVGSNKMMQETIEPESYDFDDEKDFSHPIPKTNRPKRKQVVNESVTNVGDIRSMIAEEIYKALPIVIEDYFEKRVLKENVQFKAGNTTFSGTVTALPKKKKKMKK